MTFDGFTARAKAGSNPFNPQGVHVGIVKRRDPATQTVWVELPRVAEGFDFGPVRVSSTVLPLVGQNVSCVFVEDVTDDIIVLGTVRDQDTPPFAADTAERLATPRTITLTDHLDGFTTFDGSANVTIAATPSATMDTRYWNASNLASGTVPSARVTGAYTGITGLGTLASTLNISIAGATPALNLTMASATQTALVINPSTDGTSQRASISLGGWILARDSTAAGLNDFFITDGTTTRLAISAAGVVSGDGGGLTNLNATNLVSGTVATGRIAGAYTGITSVGTLGSLAVTGAATAASFTGAHTGDGSGLTGLNATQLTTGTIPTGRLAGAYTGITSIAGLTTTPVNEVQTISISGSPSGGTFVINVLDQPVTLNYNSSAAAAQTAIQAVIGSGNATCTGGSLPGTPIVVTFAGAYAGTNVTPIDIGRNSLTGGSSPTPSVSQTTAGVGSIGGTSVSASTTVSGLSGIFSTVHADRIYMASLATTAALQIQMSDASYPGIEVRASNHPTSERAALYLGTWMQGQDVDADGGLDWFLANGSTRLSITAAGATTIHGSLTMGGQITTTSGTIGTTGISLGNGTGWYSSDATWTRTYSGKGVWTNTGWLGTDGGLTVGFGGATSGTYSVYNDGSTWSGGSNITIGQIQGRKSGLGGGWADATLILNPGSGSATVSFHVGGVAPVVGATNATGNALYFRNSVWGAGTLNCYALGWLADSSRSWKKDIATWPAKSLSAAAERPSDLVARLRPVTFFSKNGDPEIPDSERRQKAYQRLNAYKEKVGQEPYQLPDHDCSIHPCDGSVDDPCARYINFNHKRYGLIAEEVVEVIPEIVGYTDKNQPGGIDYGMLAAVLVGVVQELTERISNLEAQLTTV